MKNSLVALALGVMSFAPSASPTSLEVEVHGLTCAFCVDSLERKLKALPWASNVRISLKNKRIRLDTDDGASRIDAVNRAIRDAGFTPVKIVEVAEAEHE